MWNIPSNEQEINGNDKWHKTIVTKSVTLLSLKYRRLSRKEIRLLILSLQGTVYIKSSLSEHFCSKLVGGRNFGLFYPDYHQIGRSSAGIDGKVNGHSSVLKWRSWKVDGLWITKLLTLLSVILPQSDGSPTTRRSREYDCNWFSKEKN